MTAALQSARDERQLSPGKWRLAGHFADFYTMRMRMIFALVLASTGPSVAAAEKLPCTAGEIAAAPVQSLPVERLQTRIEAQRQILASDSKNEIARDTLADIAIQTAIALERLDMSHAPSQRAALQKLLSESLGDTLWRIGFRAGRGSRDAQLAHAYLLWNGILARRDREQACELYGRAADAGHGLAMFKAAICLGDRDSELSLSLIRRAAHAGAAAAQTTYGMICDRQGEQPGCNQQWLCKAGRQRNAQAAGMLGWLVHTGQSGLTKDPAEAARFYRFAAEAGEVAAMVQLADLLQSDALGRPDYKAAASWFRRAADRGFPPAQLQLGKAYLQGRGVPKDPLKAEFWLKAARDQGVSDASELLAQLEGD